jgi:hypothetical protein
VGSMAFFMKVSLLHWMGSHAKDIWVVAGPLVGVLIGRGDRQSESAKRLVDLTFRARWASGQFNAGDLVGDSLVVMVQLWNARRGCGYEDSPC